MTEAGLLARVEALAPTLRERSAECEAQRRLPADLAETMARAGVMHMCLPRSLGGPEVDAPTFAKALEALAEADASAGWCAMIASTSTLPAAYMEPSVAKEVFDPAFIVGGIFAPRGRAVEEDGMYRVSGRWPWGSGSANCEWMGLGCVVQGADGPKRDAEGVPETRMVYVHRRDVALLDTWEVMGLNGTGSGDVEVGDVMVPTSRSVALGTDSPHESGPLYRFPAFGLLAVGVAAVALGNAKAALAECAASLSKPKLASGATQSDYARARAAFESAHAYFHRELDATWNEALGAKSGLKDETRASLRLASTHAVRASADVCRQVYDIGGGSALYTASPLQKRFRDAHAITQHIVTGKGTYALLGRVLLGVDGDRRQL